MTNEKFYPAIERKNDYVIKNVVTIQFDKPVTFTRRKSVLNGKVLIGYKTFDTYSKEQGHYTEVINVYK